MKFSRLVCKLALSLWFFGCANDDVALSPERRADLSPVVGSADERSPPPTSDDASRSEIAQTNVTTSLSNMSHSETSSLPEGQLSVGQSETSGDGALPSDCPPRVVALIDAYGDCFNSDKSGSETDVDCGGNDCKRCELGMACEWDGDCASRHCTNGECSQTVTGPVVTPETGGVVGTRCDEDGDCELGLSCKGDFFQERPVCSKPCMSDPDCPEGSQCVEGILSVSSLPLPAHCVRPCELTPDCDPFGSECDTAEGVGGRFCF